MRSGLPRARIVGTDYNQPLCSFAWAGASESGSISSRGERGEIYHASLGAFPPGRVRGGLTEQFVSAYASNAGSCSGHGP